MSAKEAKITTKYIFGVKDVRAEFS